MRLVLLTLISILTFNQTFCQNRNSNFDLGFNFYLGIPQNEFKNNLERNGYGANFEFLWTPPRQLFSLGLNFGILNYGSITRKEPFSYTIPDVTVDVTNTNNILNYHLTFLVKPTIEFVKPYIQGFFGGSYIFTETKIQNTSTQEEIASSTNFKDYAWSYGLAGGMMIYLFRANFEREDGNVSQTEIKLNLKVSYLFGSNAKYLKEGSIKYVGQGKVDYDVLESKTDLLGIHIGLLFNF